MNCEFFEIVLIVDESLASLCLKLSELLLVVRVWGWFGLINCTFYVFWTNYVALTVC